MTLTITSGAKSTGPGKATPAPSSVRSNATVKQEVPQLIRGLLNGPHKPVNPQNASFIKDIIKKINHEQKIHNLDKWVTVFID